MTTLTEFQQGVLALAKSMSQGIKKTAPARGTYIDLCRSVKSGDPVKRKGFTHEACALGAAYVDGGSVKQVPLALQWHHVRQQFPVIETYAAGQSLGAHIIELNDTQKVSRPRIVAWLKRLAKRPMPPFAWTEVA